MSSPNYITGQSVKVTKDHNHIKAGDTVYQIGSLDRISGRISAVLLLDGKSIGAIPESCLQAAK